MDIAGTLGVVDRFLLLLVRLFLVTLLLTLTEAEEVFHRRNHRDQFALNTPSLHYQVSSERDALEYLRKYGYLDCKTSPQATTSQHPDFLPGRPGLGLGFDEETTVNEPKCPESSVKLAYVKYQKAYKLSETGVFDMATMGSMNKIRCGNKDDLVDEKNFGKKNKTGATPVRRRRRRAVEIIEQAREQRAQQAKRIAKLREKAEILAGPPVNSGLHQHLVNIREHDHHRTHSSRKIRDAQLEDIRQQIQNEVYHPRKRRSLPKSADRVLVRRKRSDNGPNGTGFSTQGRCVTWRLVEFSTRIPASEQRPLVHLAFRMWSEVIPLCFREDISNSIMNVDIQIAFGRKTHQNCGKPFDGNGGDLAHSWPQGDIHLDDDENYVADVDNNAGIDLLKVCVHEIGHVLGLGHVARDYSIMFAIYLPMTVANNEFELGWEDRKYVQNIYGVCKGNFDMVFDWVRPIPGGNPVFNTYFFRHGYYWMYENRHNRTRYGDPLKVTIEWKGLTGKLDAYVQVMHLVETSAGSWRLQIDTMFFAGDNYYMYDHDADRVQTGYPRPIAQDFGAAANSTERVPDNLDSAFYSNGDGNIYFFKDKWVWIYHMVDKDNVLKKRGCCEPGYDGAVKSSFKDLFPPAPGETKILDGNIDAAYYSWTDYHIYFFKGEEVWKKENDASRRLTYMGKWYEERWYDICDVEPIT